jgi:hypothetical protein
MGWQVLPDKSFSDLAYIKRGFKYVCAYKGNTSSVFVERLRRVGGSAAVKYTEGCYSAFHSFVIVSSPQVSTICTTLSEVPPNPGAVTVWPLQATCFLCYHTALFRVVSDVTPRLRTKLSVLSIYWVKIGTVEGILASVGQVLSIRATFMADLDEIRTCARKALLFYICSCTLKPYDIVKVKNASIKSVHYARKYTICSRAVGTDISKFVSLPELRRRPVCLLTSAVSSYRACLPACVNEGWAVLLHRIIDMKQGYSWEADWSSAALCGACMPRTLYATTSHSFQYLSPTDAMFSRLHVSIVMVVYVFFHAFYMHCQSHDHWFDIPIVYV